MHADGVAAEAPPIGKPVGFDDDVAEVHMAKYRGRLGCWRGHGAKTE